MIDGRIGTAAGPQWGAAAHLPLGGASAYSQEGGMRLPGAACLSQRCLPLKPVHLPVAAASQIPCTGDEPLGALS